MFGFHAFESQFAIHKIESEFWEEILENIYKKVLSKHKPCLGLISNTFKEKVGLSDLTINKIVKEITRILEQ